MQERLKLSARLLTPRVRKASVGKKLRLSKYRMRSLRSLNGVCRVSRRYTISPNDHMSAADGGGGADGASAPSPISSGAMYPGVPRTVDGTPTSSVLFVMPKSLILTHHGLGGHDLTRTFYICHRFCQGFANPHTHTRSEETSNTD
jgi:hypothetical protein